MSNEILIIGGGFAGLAAGVALSASGRRVRLLEQKPYLGGRARSFLDPETRSTVDNGQHIFMGCYHSTRRLLATLGTEACIRFQRRLAVPFLDSNGCQTALECADFPAPWHLLVGVLRSDSFTTRQKFEVLRLGRMLDSAQGSESASEHETVEQWLSRLGQSEILRRNFWDLLCIAALNEDPRIASAFLFGQVLRLALFRSPEDSRLGIARVGLSECYTQAAADYLAARGGRVETNRNVSGFLISGGRCAGVRTQNGEAIEARAVVSAVPWHQFIQLIPGELLRSEQVFTNILTLRPAPIISINLWFDRPITDLEFAGLRGTTVQWLFNKGLILSGAARGGDGGYVSLVLSGAHAHIARAKEELLAVALDELGRLLPTARGAKLRHSLVLKERFATFSPTPEAQSVRPQARTPVEGLYLAGDWTATGLPATIEGAVKSGYTAAGEILGLTRARREDEP